MLGQENWIRPMERMRRNHRQLSHRQHTLFMHFAQDSIEMTQFYYTVTSSHLPAPQLVHGGSQSAVPATICALQSHRKKPNHNGGIVLILI